MAVVAKSAWERQQQRARAVETAARLPALSRSKLLSLVSQMTVALQQLNATHMHSEDASYLQNLIKHYSSSSEESTDIAAALVVCMLMRTWAASSNEGAAGDGLGSWNAWKSSPGKKKFCMGKLIE